MCGISGIIRCSESSIPSRKILESWEEMFRSTLRRGSDASGVVGISSNKLLTYKQSGQVHDLLSSPQYRKLRASIDETPSGSPFALIGHSRLVTNGRASRGENNQPVVIDDLILIHNGIVANDLELRASHDFDFTSDLDSETIALLLQAHGVSLEPSRAILQTFSELKGNSTIVGILPSRNSCLIATNNGSMYIGFNSELGIIVFGSEPLFVENAYKNFKGASIMTDVIQMQPNTFAEISLSPSVTEKISVTHFKEIIGTPQDKSTLNGAQKMEVLDFSISELPDFDSLKRCTKCILPSSFPGVEIDGTGICRYCQGESAPALPLLGIEKLMDALNIGKNGTNENPILVGVSGGRDSCYGLHLLKSVLKLNVVAYTYDWGMVTDLARRNIARICGELGIEHIIIAPNTSTKLRNVRLNLQAWKRKPDIGMVPLLMAGDKQFYKYAHHLRNERNSPSVVLCAGNTYETTDFKAAFAGVRQMNNRGVLRDTTSWQAIKLFGYYFNAALKNPLYLNASLPDTLSAFWSSYFLTDNYVYLFNYVPWDEDEILKTLRDEYEWEDASDTSATWRIGDGTSAFYNYVYYSVAGFTESDTFRSHQIRAGVLSRESALIKVREENQPRWEALQWYAETVGVNLEELLTSVNSLKKLW